jgi:2-C-methyl-D-erythritol 4-phosphate cytidylyltransferase
VRIVEGGPRNLKITLPEDLALAEMWLKSESADPSENSDEGEKQDR